jgi:3-hydroxyacyl-[acyl-carrier-protein] dehydratase
MPMTPLLARDAVQRYLPQHPPMVMVHELLSATPDELLSRFHVLPTDVFAEDGVLLEGGVIENVAQTAALGMGFSAAQEGAPPPVGFIGAVSKLTIVRLPRIGETLHTTVRVTHRLDQVQVLFGVVHVGEERLAEMEMKVFLVGDAAA